MKKNLVQILMDELHVKSITEYILTIQNAKKLASIFFKYLNFSPTNSFKFWGCWYIPSTVILKQHFMPRQIEAVGSRPRSLFHPPMAPEKLHRK